MAEESIFGTPLDSPADEIVEETTPEATTEEGTAEAPSEGSPSKQPRDDQGRFLSFDELLQGAPEEEQQTPEAATEEIAPTSEDVGTDAPEVAAPEGPTDEAVQAWIDSMPEGVTFAGKWTNPFDAERGYNESRDMWRRANEARKAESQRALELQERYAQLYQQMEGVVPILEQAAQRERAYQAFAEKYREQMGVYPEGYEPPAPPQALGPQDVNAVVEQRLAQERAQMAEQFQAQQEYQQLQGAIFGFYEEHPEVEPGGALDSEITDAKDYLNDAWDRWGIEVDTADPGSLNILYEASRDPALLEVLRLNPSYFESAYGMQLARRDALVISGRVPPTTEPVTKTVPSSQVKATGEKKPYVESALIGTEAPEAEDPDDEWNRIKNAELGPTSRRVQDRSVFFE